MVIALPPRLESCRRDRAILEDHARPRPAGTAALVGRQARRRAKVRHGLRRLRPGPLAATAFRVLEIGCGDQGGITPVLVAAGYDVLAIDPRAPAGRATDRSRSMSSSRSRSTRSSRARAPPRDTPRPALSKLAGSHRCSSPTSSRGIGSTQRCNSGTSGSTPSGATTVLIRRGRRTSTRGAPVTSICTRSETLLAALDAVYETDEVEWRPYLYHWLGDRTEPLERAAIDAGELPAIWYRFTGRARPR